MEPILLKEIAWLVDKVEGAFAIYTSPKTRDRLVKMVVPPGYEALATISLTFGDLDVLAVAGMPDNCVVVIGKGTLPKQKEIRCED